MGNFRFGVDLLTYYSAGFDTYKKRGAETVFSKLREFGCEGVEPMGIHERMGDVPPIAELLKSYQLEVIDVTGIWGRFGSVVGTYPNKDPTSSDPVRKKNAIEYVRKCADIALMFDTPYVQVALGSLEEQDLTERGIGRARKNLVELLRKSSKYCKDRGVRIILEPQCRFEGYYGVNSTMEQVLGIIDEVDRDNVVPMLDTFHANVEEPSISRAIRAAGKKLAFVHSTDSNRLPPGFGSIDFRSVLRELAAVGYKGYLSIESVPIGPNADSKVKRGLNYLKALYSFMQE
jgi:sugar phosphate isomerase/epimerase